MNDPTNPRVLDANNPPATVLGVADLLALIQNTLPEEPEVAKDMAAAAERHLRQIAQRLGRTHDALGLQAKFMDDDGLQVEARQVRTDAGTIGALIGDVL